MRLSFFVTIESSRSVDSIVWHDKIGFMCGISYSREWNRGPLPVPADAHLRPAYGRPPVTYISIENWNGGRQRREKETKNEGKRRLRPARGLI